MTRATGRLSYKKRQKELGLIDLEKTEAAGPAPYKCTSGKQMGRRKGV